MQIPLEWLRDYVTVDDAVEVGTRLTMGGLEVEGIETEQLPERPLVPVLDVYVTPNRGDCLSMVGVAREVAALYGIPLRTPQIPDVAIAVNRALVSIQAPDLCPRYAARLVRNVKVGPSPEWMQARLLSAGMRPINNVVDVTNYVMLEFGQPLHAFDLDKLEGGRIIVRRARIGETITTLDGVERRLTPEMLVIADAANAVAVAGVMGGATSEIGSTTTNLLIESAHFNPLSVRRTSRGLALRTDASYRFERVVDLEGVQRAANRACQLLAEMGAGEVTDEIMDVYPIPVSPRSLVLRVARASELLGMDIGARTAADCLARLGFRVSIDPIGEALLVDVPSFRFDINLEEDLVEEVGRIYGYENIPETLPVGGTTSGGDSDDGRLIMRIKKLLTACGLQEVVTHSLTAPSFFDTPADASLRVPVRNALSAEISGLRRSLIPTLLDVARHNAAHGQNALAIFEVGRVWQHQPSLGGMEPYEFVAVAGLLVGPLTAGDWQHDAKPIVADYSLARGVMERLLNGLRIEGAEFVPPSGRSEALPAATLVEVNVTPILSGEEATQQFHPGRTAYVRLTADSFTDGVIGEIHPSVAAELSLRDRVYVFEVGLEGLKLAARGNEPCFRPLNRFPAVSRDLAPRVPVDMPYIEIKRSIDALDLVLLEEFRLIDVFTGPPVPEGSKSMTLAFSFRSNAGTLTEAEVNDALGCIRTTLEQQCRAYFAV
jgi:phenylalanyl-tRNA synthetase beta chain